MKTPGAHVLAQGVPPMSTLPLAGVTLSLTDGSTVTLDDVETLNAQRYAPFAWAPLRSWLLEHMAEQHAATCGQLVHPLCLCCCTAIGWRR